MISRIMVEDLACQTMQCDNKYSYCGRNILVICKEKGGTSDEKE